MTGHILQEGVPYIVNDFGLGAVLLCCLARALSYDNTRVQVVVEVNGVDVLNRLDLLHG